MAELLKDSEWMKTLCPACKKPLALGEVMTVSGHRYIVWCPRLDCHNMADGPNEGGYGKSPEKALKILMAKLGISKDYEIDAVETPDEPASTDASSPVVEKKKRGRKPKGTVEVFRFPEGKFTMGEFCELNNTYPYKATPFFKEKGVREVGKRPTASGRGKPAILYAVEI